jgi:septum formation protein
MLLHESLKDYRLILASQSPRRKMLLEGLDLTFQVLVKEAIDESYPEDLDMTEIPEYLARKKSDHYVDNLDERAIVITADTIVWLDDKVVGKPVDLEDARNIISRLSGNTHTVVTGVCIRSAKKMKVFHSVSRVHFRKLDPADIDYYIDTYQPYDKAGAYGIQEWIGYVGIEEIEGSFFNVMGLPVQKLYHELMEFVENT